MEAILTRVDKIKLSIKLEDLPYDIWPLILSHIPRDTNRLPRDLVRLSSTCRKLRDAVQPALFSTVTFRGPLGSGKLWSAYVQYLLERLESAPSLRQHVKVCRIFGWHAPLPDMAGLAESDKSMAQELLSSAFRALALMPNVSYVYLRSVLVPDEVFQGLRRTNLETLNLLFCDLRAVCNNVPVEGGAFKHLQTAWLHDVWWTPGRFTFDDIVTAPRMKSISLQHSSDFASPVAACLSPSPASKLHFFAPSGVAWDDLHTFLRLFPRVETLRVHWDDTLPGPSLKLDPDVLPLLRAFRGPLSTISSHFIQGRRVKNVEFLYRNAFPPDPSTARALSDSLGDMAVEVEEMTLRGLTLADYSSILVCFASRLQKLRTFRLHVSDDSIGKESFAWVTEHRILFPRLEQLTFGNELPEGSAAAVPGDSHDRPLVELWGATCPSLQELRLPGRCYDRLSHGGWRRTAIPSEDPPWRSG